MEKIANVEKNIIDHYENIWPLCVKFWHADKTLGLHYGFYEKGIKTLVGGFVGFLSSTLLVLFFFIFISQEASTLPQRLENAYGPHRAAQILEIGRRINRGIIGYVYVKGLASV